MIEPWKRTKIEPYPPLGYRKVERWWFELPDGAQAPFDIMIGMQTAAAFALTSDKKVIIAQQFRPGPQLVMPELPAGLIEKGEEPQAAMERELLEETGYTAGTLTYLGPTHKDAYSNTVHHIFVATDCVKTTDTLVLDPTEFIEPILVPLDEFRKIMKKGLLTNTTAAYMGLDYLGLL
jgi:ADP-ribose pyrophosphatase